MSRLRIGYFGDGQWASHALEGIIARSDIFDVVFVVPRFDTVDPALARISKKNSVDFLLVENVNDPEWVENVRAMEIDVIVSMSFNQIMKAELANSARIAAINCHAGDLPRYRGRNVINWAIINGESSLGITVHLIDSGIDTGDIIDQSRIGIDDRDSYAEVLEKAYPECASVLISSLEKIADGTWSARPQPLDGGFYCSRRREGDEWIDWELPSVRINNLVRGISHPGPGAYFAIGTEVYAAHRSSLVPEVPNYIGVPGDVVGRDDAGVVVKTGDSVLRLERCSTAGNNNCVFSPKWRIGTRLAGKTEYRLARLERIAGIPA